VLLGFFILIVEGMSHGKTQPSLLLHEDMYRITLKSNAFTHGEPMPERFTCDGENVSPLLEIGDIPEGTKTLALVMHDPDAPVPGGWTHWIKFNIPPETKNLPEGQEPPGISGKGGRDNFTYKGPCPPSGTHRYFFKIYALDSELPLKEGIGKSELESAIEGHILGFGELVGLYSRKK